MPKLWRRTVREWMGPYTKLGLWFPGQSSLSLTILTLIVGGKRSVQGLQNLTNYLPSKEGTGEKPLEHRTYYFTHFRKKIAQCNLLEPSGYQKRRWTFWTGPLAKLCTNFLFSVYSSASLNTWSKPKKVEFSEVKWWLLRSFTLQTQRTERLYCYLWKLGQTP